MTIELPVRLLDRPFSIALADADVERVAAQWSRCIDHDPCGMRGQTIVRGSGANDDGSVWDYDLVSRLTLAAIESRSGELVMLHAAGVADPTTGRTAVLVAGSGTGKTTAAMTLCANAFGYVTDETVAFDARGVVTPYPKPLSVKTGAGGGKTQHGPDELGLVPAPEDCTVGLIVVLDRCAEHATAAARTLPLIDGVLALLPQTSALSRLPHPLRLLATRVAATGGVRSFRYAEAADLIPLVQQGLREGARHDQEFVHLPPPADGPTPPREGHGKLRRSAYTDAISADGEVLVLIGSAPLRLGGIAATVWTELDVPRSTDDLLRACVDVHGDHPDAARLVQLALEQLLAAGIVQTASSAGHANLRGS